MAKNLVVSYIVLNFASSNKNNDNVVKVDNKN